MVNDHWSFNLRLEIFRKFSKFCSSTSNGHLINEKDLQVHIPQLCFVVGF